MKLPLVLAVALLGACAVPPKLGIVGHVVDKPGLAEAQALVWRTAYHRADASPLVFIVEESDQTCTNPANDQAGFECPTVGCAQGCTSNPYGVSVAFGTPWSGGTLAHEDMHALKMRQAIEVLRYSPTHAAMQLLADRDHKGPEWEPGGDVDRANVLLAEHGL